METSDLDGLGRGWFWAGPNAMLVEVDRETCDLGVGELGFLSHNSTEEPRMQLLIIN